MRRLPAIPLLLLLASVAAAQGLPPAGVKTATVTREIVRDRVTGVATVEPWIRTVLSSEAAGLIVKYPLREGDPVEAGKTVVCELKKTALLIDLAEAEALLERAEAKSATEVDTARATVEELRALRDRADREFERAKVLFGKQVVNKAELDRAEADSIAARYKFERARDNYELAESGADPASKALQAEVRRAKARLDRVKDQLLKTRIVSPLTGLVVRRHTEVGAWASPGSPVVEVATFDPVLVRVGVNERNIPKISVGDPVAVRVDAFPGRTFAGKVRFIVPEAGKRTRAFPVQIEVANPDALLLSGMFARVEIEAGEGREALVVPKDAIVRSPRGVMMMTPVPGKNAKGEDILVGAPVPVRVGAAVGGKVVVTGEGVKEGMTVITTGNAKMIPGQQVILMGPQDSRPHGPRGGDAPHGGGGERR